MDNRRKSIVVNKPFQYQYSLLAVALTVLLVNIALIIQILVPSGKPLVLTSQMAMGLGALEFFLVVGAWYGSIGATHRIAGPVFVFSRELAKLGRGDLTVHIGLRKSDMFQEAAEDINASIGALRTRIAEVKRISALLEAAQLAHADTGGLVEALQRELATLNTEQAQQPALRQQPVPRQGEEQCLAK